MSQEVLGEQLRKGRAAADPPDRVGQGAVDAVILQADQEKFLLWVCLLRCMKNLGYGLLDILVVLIVVAQVVEELAGKDSSENSYSISLRGAVLSVRPMRRSRWAAESSKGLWGR